MKSKPEATTCIPCNVVNFYENKANVDPTCTSCPAGKVDEDSSTTTECTDCAKGTNAAAGSTVCGGEAKFHFSGNFKELENPTDFGQKVCNGAETLLPNAQAGDCTVARVTAGSVVVTVTFKKETLLTDLETMAKNEDFGFKVQAAFKDVTSGTFKAQLMKYEMPNTVDPTQKGQVVKFTEICELCGKTPAFSEDLIRKAMGLAGIASDGFVFSIAANPVHGIAMSVYPKVKKSQHIGKG